MVSAEVASRAAGTAVVTEPQGDRWPFYLYCRQQGLWPREVAGLDPITQRDALLKYCPLYNLPRDYPPTLLLHGDADTDVPYRQSADMDAALTRLGVEHEFVSVPGGGHGFDGGQSTPAARAALAGAMAFLDKHVKGPSVAPRR
jgi:dipeptidyl aminopeptidase/acylaminoacyl peptidase